VKTVSPGTRVSDNSRSVTLIRVQQFCVATVPLFRHENSKNGRRKVLTIFISPRKAAK